MFLFITVIIGIYFHQRIKKLENKEEEKEITIHETENTISWYDSEGNLINSQIKNKEQ